MRVWKFWRSGNFCVVLRGVRVSPAKTANKALINIRAPMPYAEHLTHPGYFVASHTVFCAAGLPGTDYETTQIHHPGRNFVRLAYLQLIASRARGTRSRTIQSRPRAMRVPR